MENKPVSILTPITKANWSKSYIALREKENRLLTDHDVMLLPFLPAKKPHAKEWRLRVETLNRIISYLKEKKSALKILDIGCGNGWFTHKLSKLPHTDLTGIDINIKELEQGARLFKKSNLQFVYGDIFELISVYKDTFDIITLNASVQYFNDLPKLLQLLNTFLTADGEIHILDSPFYKKQDLAKAKKNSDMYYSNLGFPEMTHSYFHHCLEDFQQVEVLYKPRNKILGALFGIIKNSPFMHIKVSKLQ